MSCTRPLRRLHAAVAECPGGKTRAGLHLAAFQPGKEVCLVDEDLATLAASGDPVVRQASLLNRPVYRVEGDFPFQVLTGFLRCQKCHGLLPLSFLSVSFVVLQRGSGW